MSSTGHAYFVDFPRTIEDLRRLHDVRLEQEYEVVKTISLAPIDFENFITDLVADRQFIEDNYRLCSEGEVWKCLLVRSDGSKHGVLVMPGDVRYVKYAACVAL